MSTNPRTLRLVTALAENHPEFREKVKPGWFSYPPYGSELEPTHAPNLTDRRNLAELFDVCQFLKLEPIQAWYLSTAALIPILLAAAEAALGLEKWEEMKRA